MLSNAILSALLAIPAVLASPLITAAPIEARATTVPTCNANNVAIFKSDYPASKSFCSSWGAQATHTKSPISQLQIFQISNICSCILAPTYVAGPALSTSLTVSKTSSSISSTSVSSTTSSTSGSSTVSSKSSVSSTISSKSSSSASSSKSSSSLPSTTSSKSSSTTSSSKSSSFVLSTTLSKSSSTTSSSRSSSSVSSTTSSKSSSKTSSSKSSSTSSSSSSSATSATVPPIFNIYIGSPSATSGGAVLQGSGTYDSIGLFPTPTPYVPSQAARARKRSTTSVTASPYAASSCVPGRSYVHGTEYFSVCDSKDTSDSTTGVEQPTTLDNITTMAGCITFCDEQGSACAGIQFTQVVKAGKQQCKLFSSFSAYNVGAGSGSHVAYKAAEVPSLEFTFDAESGYLYQAGDSANVLAMSFESYYISAIVAPIEFNNPLICAIDAELRLTCAVNPDFFEDVWSAWNLTGVVDSTTGEQDLMVLPGAADQSTVGLYVAPITVTNSSSSTYKYTNGNNTILLSTQDFVNAQNTTTAGASLSNANGAVTMNFAVDSTVASTVLVVEDIPLFEGDTYRFTADIDFTYGHLPAHLQCVAGLSFSADDTVAKAEYASNITFDSSFPTQFSIVWEGTTTATNTVPVKFSISCSELSGAQVYSFPIAINSITFESDPTTATGAVLPANSDGQVFVQYYSGSNTQLPNVLNDAIVSGPTALYVGSQAAAVSSCVATAGTAGAFEVYYSAGAWNCVVYTQAWASPSLFANANSAHTQVVGYYRSTLLSLTTETA